MGFLEEGKEIFEAAQLIYSTLVDLQNCPYKIQTLMEATVCQL
jgi:hypothetical protein